MEKDGMRKLKNNIFRLIEISTKPNSVCGMSESELL
jgi:hypothetical protein